jgi:hypothetical protein
LAWITWKDVLVAYVIDVPSIGANWGGPPYTTLTVVVAMFTSALCGIWACATASLASGVPGTEDRTAARGPSDGMFAKSAGRLGVA